MLNSAKGHDGVWRGFKWVICGTLVWAFSSLVSQQQAVVFLCQTLCQRRNMRAVSGDPCQGRDSPHHSGAVAGRETWHTASRAPQGWQHWGFIFFSTHHHSHSGWPECSLLGGLSGALKGGACSTRAIEIHSCRGGVDGMRWTAILGLTGSALDPTGPFAPAQLCAADPA